MVEWVRPMLREATATKSEQSSSKNQGKNLICDGNTMLQMDHNSYKSPTLSQMGLIQVGYNWANLQQIICFSIAVVETFAVGRNLVVFLVQIWLAVRRASFIAANHRTGPKVANGLILSIKNLTDASAIFASQNIGSRSQASPLGSVQRSIDGSQLLHAFILKSVNTISFHRLVTRCLIVVYFVASGDPWSSL